MFKYYTLKKYVWLLILTVFVGNFGFSQINGGYPNTHSQSNSNTLENFNGGVSAQSFQFRRNFADTASANATSLKDAPFIEINVNDSIFKRNGTATRWVNLSTIGSSVPPSCYGLIFGGVVTLNTGLILNVTNAQYCINGTTYNSPSTTVTLAAADPVLNRKDVIAANTSGQAIVITGTSAVNPIEPQIDPQTQVKLGVVDIPANATTPENITRVIIYNEDDASPIEWSHSTAGLTAGSIDFANTNFPYIGSISADVASGTLGTVQFTKFDTIRLSSFDVFQMFLRPKAAIPDASKIEVAFTFGGNLVSGYVNCDNTKGYIKLNSGSYQNISISRAAFAPMANDSIDGISIRFTGTNSGFYIDYIQLQSGVIPPIPDYDGSYLRKKITDSLYVVTYGLDSLKLSHFPTSADIATAFPSPPLSFLSTVRDTVNNVNLKTGFDIGIEGSRGTATPRYDLYFKNNTGLKNMVMKQDGSNQMWNGLLFDKENLSSRIFTQSNLLIRAQGATDQVRVVNGAGSALTGDFVKIETGSQWVFNQTANALNVTGANGSNVFQVKQRGIGAMNAPTNENLTMDFQGPLQGVRFDTMTTAQLAGMGWMIDQITLTNSGSGYTLGVPSFSASSNTSGRPAVVVVSANLTTGTVNGIQLAFHGNGYTSGGSLTVNNTGTGGSGAAGTYTVKFVPIPTGTIIYNIDSLKYFQYNGTSWECMCGLGGGGGSQDLNTTLGYGNTTTLPIIINSGQLYFDNAATTTYVNGGVNNTGSIRNTFVGLLSGENNTGSDQTFVGYSAGRNNTQDGNTAIGTRALSSTTPGGITVNNCTAVGKFAGINNTGRGLTALGNISALNNNYNYVIALGVAAQANADYQFALSDSISNIKATGIPTGAGYVLTDVAGDGKLTLQPPSGGSGTVTSVATGYGLTGGTITTSGTLSLDSATVYSYVRSLITPAPTDTLQFDPYNFRLDSSLNKQTVVSRDSVIDADLASTDLIIEFPAIYNITHGSGVGLVSFPDPTLFSGQTITILNTDADDQNTANYQGANKPYVNGDNTQWSGLPYAAMHIYKSIDGKWRGGSLGL